MDPEQPKGLCSNCNRAVELDAEVCPYCNAPLTNRPSVSPDEPRSQ